jgi:glycosyltransferase involved in cell wall biosynthesis
MSSADDRKRQRVCVLLPAYREAGRIGSVVAGVRAHVPDVLVVDDGSPDGTAAEAGQAGAVVVRHETNKGKGVALATGFEHARKAGFDVVITMDADGQHDPSDLSRFVEAYVRTGIPVILGNRMGHTERMPAIRRWTNRFMSWLLSREMKQYVPDTQCGYRLYRNDVIPFVAARASGFAAESETLLHVADRGIRIDSVPIAAVYRDEKSKIRPIQDTIRFFAMLARYRRAKRRASR